MRSEEVMLLFLGTSYTRFTVLKFINLSEFTGIYDVKIRKIKLKILDEKYT